MTADPDERIRTMDGIVGRCIRDLEFGRRVLEDPVNTLAGYQLTQEELNDFIALARIEGVLERWKIWHDRFAPDTA